jgi:hypothetical protein
MNEQRGVWVVTGVLLAAVVLWNVTRAGEASDDVRAEAHTTRTIAGAVRPFWWTHLGTQSTASVWIGPPIEYVSGERRRTWTLVCTQPGSEEPLSCLQGSVPLDDNSPIGFKNALSYFELRPLEGWTWGQVDSQESLEVQLEGFY